MIDLNLVFETQLILQEERYGNAYDTADVPLVQDLIIAFTPITAKRDERLKIIGDLVGRPLKTTKELKVGEVHALLAMLDKPELMRGLKEEYGQV